MFIQVKGIEEMFGFIRLVWLSSIQIYNICENIQ